MDNFIRLSFYTIKVNSHSIYKKTTPDFSIVKRLGGSGAEKIGILSITTKHL